MGISRKRLIDEKESRHKTGGKHTTGRENSKCKILEVGVDLANLRNFKEASDTEAE